MSERELSDRVREDNKDTKTSVNNINHGNELTDGTQDTPVDMEECGEA